MDSKRDVHFGQDATTLPRLNPANAPTPRQLDHALAPRFFAKAVEPGSCNALPHLPALQLQVAARQVALAAGAQLARSKAGLACGGGEAGRATSML